MRLYSKTFVFLSKKGEETFSNSSRNPHATVGEVLYNTGYNPYSRNIVVSWASGRLNSYFAHELEYGLPNTSFNPKDYL